MKNTKDEGWSVFPVFFNKATTRMPKLESHSDPKILQQLLQIAEKETSEKSVDV